MIVISTNFYVCPGNENIPTFEEILALGNYYLNKFTNKFGDLKRVNLDVELFSIKDKTKVFLNKNDKIIRSEDYYAWFFINNIDGGTDFYFFKMYDIDKQAWIEEYSINERARELKTLIDKSIELGYHWSFRRSAGQPGIINLAYGLLAASLAKLTNGILYSDDGAWEYSFFPTLADDFLKWYFDISKLSRKEDKEFIIDSINSIISQLK